MIEFIKLIGFVELIMLIALIYLNVMPDLIRHPVMNGVEKTLDSGSSPE